MLGLFLVIRQGLEANHRFLWIANLSRPDALLALLLTALAGLMTAVAPTASNAASLRFAIMLSVIVTFLMVSRVAAGVALYWGVSSAFGVVQGLILRREARIERTVLTPECLLFHLVHHPRLPCLRY